MDVREVVAKFGGQSALAKALGINQSAIAYWVKRNGIPAKWHAVLLKIAIDKAIPLEATDLVSRAPARTADPRQRANLAPQDDPKDGSLPGHPFLFYTAASGAIKVQVVVEDESVWATQQGIAEIFDTTKQTVSYHLTNIFRELELDQQSVVKEILTTAVDGKRYMTAFYNLDAIISVGYRINSYRATQFRVWATTVLREYMIKGFALNDDRLKQGKALFGKDYFDDLLEKIREIRASERRFYQKITDIYAQCSIDYDPRAPISQKFYAHVQDKMHFAIHGHTSAELISLRADASKPHMGLTHWKNEGVGGKITKMDVTVGKNYLSKTEIDELERLVSMYLEWAENFARRQRALTMADWAAKLDGFLEFNTYDVLNNYGAVKRDDAERCALREFEKYRVVQDKDYKSDFDKIVDEIKITKKLPTGNR